MDQPKDGIAFYNFKFAVGRLADQVVLSVEWKEHPRPRCFVLSPEDARLLSSSIEQTVKDILDRPTTVS